VIRALDVVPLELPPEVEMASHLPERRPDPHSQSQWGAVPHDVAAPEWPPGRRTRTWSPEGGSYRIQPRCGDVQRSALLCHGVASEAVSLCRSPRRARGSGHTPARPIVFTDRRPLRLGEPLPRQL